MLCQCAFALCLSLSQGHSLPSFFTCARHRVTARILLQKHFENSTCLVMLFLFCYVFSASPQGKHCAQCVCQWPVTISSSCHLYAPWPFWCCSSKSAAVEYILFPLGTVISEIPPGLCVFFFLYQSESGGKTELCVSVTMSDRNRSELVMSHPYLSFPWCSFQHTALPALDGCQRLFNLH